MFLLFFSAMFVVWLSLLRKKCKNFPPFSLTLPKQLMSHNLSEGLSRLLTSFHRISQNFFRLLLMKNKPGDLSKSETEKYLCLKVKLQNQVSDEELELYFWYKSKIVIKNKLYSVCCSFCKDTTARFTSL